MANCAACRRTQRILPLAPARRTTTNWRPAAPCRGGWQAIALCVACSCLPGAAGRGTPEVLEKAGWSVSEEGAIALRVRPGYVQEASIGASA